ncbi:hypothetical protein SAMN04488122_4319 [Chitinophaga arvensicola]|uniref:DinB superfamily protein n=2 Tax=Chitinophaga arvensicola TaxID=29529 RepID=A0A1I0S740_9BACT|nr:hypothetical protein SAMN04488122_4319 [Chitinophaga arvensicola]
MSNVIIATLCRNFLAAIDMAHQVLVLAPEELLEKDRRFFYMAYHSLIFLDYYLSDPVRDFHPKLSYTIHHADVLPAEAVDDVLPDRIYTKDELLTFLRETRGKCETQFRQMTGEKLLERWITDNEVDMHGLCPPLVSHYSRLEILLYNLRHLQHHTGQLNLLLRLKANVAADWVSQSPCL